MGNFREHLADKFHSWWSDPPTPGHPLDLFLAAALHFRSAYLCQSERCSKWFKKSYKLLLFVCRYLLGRKLGCVWYLYTLKTSDHFFFLYHTRLALLPDVKLSGWKIPQRLECPFTNFRENASRYCGLISE